jgi:virulence factor
MNGDPKPLKIVLIGAGAIARKAYLPLLRTWPGIQIVGLFSRTQESVDHVCRDWQIDFGTTHLEELFGLHPDAAFVLTNTTSHADLARRILEAGVDVFLEKPATVSSAQTYALAEQAAARGRVLMVGFNRRYAPLYQQAKECFTGRQILQIVVEKHRPTAFHVSLFNNYLDDTIHIIDLVRYFCGEVQPLHTSFTMQAGRVFNANSLMALPGGGSAMVLTCLQAGSWQERVSLHGEKLTVEVSAFRELRVKYPDHEEVHGNDRPGRWMSELTERGFSGEIVHFFDCVRNRTRPNPDGYEAARTQELVEALTRLAGAETEFLPYAEGEV